VDDELDCVCCLRPGCVWVLCVTQYAAVPLKQTDRGRCRERRCAEAPPFDIAMAFATIMRSGPIPTAALTCWPVRLTDWTAWRGRYENREQISAVVGGTPSAGPWSRLHHYSLDALSAFEGRSREAYSEGLLMNEVAALAGVL